MFLSKENLILEPNNKYTQIGNLFDESESSVIDICALKTSLFPTIKIAYNSQIKCPIVYQKDGKNFLKNKFIDVKEIVEKDYIFVPKISVKEDFIIDKTIAWLYGKYISSGYHKKNSEIQQIIIPVQRISQKEENQLLKLDSVFTIKSTLQPYKKLIIINNENIINMFSNFTKSKSLKQFIIDSPANIFNTFLHSIMIECDEYKRIQIENIGLAHEIFIHAYSKNNKILKITEERTGSKKKKSKNKKKYYISFADKDDYDIIAGNLYTKVIQNRIGRNTIGIDINKNNIFDKKELICNSIIIQVPPLILN